MIKLLRGELYMKSFFELQKLQIIEEQKLDEELKKIDNAEEYFKNQKLLNFLAITFFVMNLIVIVTASLNEYMLFETNSIKINLVILVFIILSLISLISSIFYKAKTLETLEQHYKKYQD